MRLHLLLRMLALSLAALHAAGALSQSSGQIVIDGPRAAMPLATALAKAFQLRNPGLGVVIERDLGMVARMEALIQGNIDVAVATNGLDLAFVSREGLLAHPIARTAVVFAVNAGVALDNLTRGQICDVYDGHASNWKALGGPDLAIAPHSLPGSHVDIQLVRDELQCLKHLRATQAVRIMGRSERLDKALATTPGAIGITTSSAVVQSGGRMRMVTVDGVAPSPDNIEHGRYGMVRETWFVTWSTPDSPVARLLEFTRSAEGRELIRVNGAIPAKQRALQEPRGK